MKEDIIMKRLVLCICAFCIVSSVLAQRYDYDDIYFNPKKDITPVVETPKVVVEEKVAPTAEVGYSDDGMSYTARINMFHRTEDSTQQRLAHIADPNYTTNVFVLTDGQYVVDVDASLIEFVQKYRATIDEDDYLRFEWDLSSGEMLLLTAYARFYDDKTKNTNSNIKNRIVLLDEAEVSFHPEWQRIYLSNMLKFFKDLYNNCHVQLIIATHSPIILSDIPKQNILGKDIDKNFRINVDIVTVEFDDAIKQSLDTILGCIKGSIPSI